MNTEEMEVANNNRGYMRLQEMPFLTSYVLPGARRGTL